MYYANHICVLNCWYISLHYLSCEIAQRYQLLGTEHSKLFLIYYVNNMYGPGFYCILLCVYRANFFYTGISAVCLKFRPLVLILCHVFMLLLSSSSWVSNVGCSNSLNIKIILMYCSKILQEKTINVLKYSNPALI